LLGDESAAGEIVDERLIDRRALELEVVEVLGERQLGDGPRKTCQSTFGSVRLQADLFLNAASVAA
jgi:hypothetical protein